MTYYAASNPQNSNMIAPHPHDVLSGRGAGITKHPGNKRWRDLIHTNREKYTSLPRNQRPLVAEEIVRAVGSLSPPGRFLAKDVNSQQWYIIGDQKAIEKTAQAMRDSKKNSTSRSPSPPPMTTLKKTAVEPSPSIAKPSLARLGTDDSFLKQMEDNGFALERHSSAMFMDLVGSSLHMLTNNDADFDMDMENAEPVQVQCSPEIPKPNVDRGSTFDANIDEFTFSTPTPPPTRTESGCSFASFGMLPEEEFELLEASNEMPTAAQRFSHMNMNLHMSLPAPEPQGQMMEDLMMMAMDDSMHCGYTKRTNPNNVTHAFHYSI